MAVPYTPEPVLEFAFGHGPFYELADEDWTDVSDAVKAASPGHGRSNELDLFSAGTMTVELADDDRTFDPLNADGPYYGQLLPGVPVRLRAKVGDDYFPRWYGFVDGWRSRPGTVQGEATVECTDAFTHLARVTLPTVYEAVVLGEEPHAYWRLGSTGAKATDQSGNRFDGDYASSVGRDLEALVVGGTGSTRFDGLWPSTPDPQRMTAPADARIIGEPFSITWWMRLDDPQVNAVGGVLWQGSATTSQRIEMDVRDQLTPRRLRINSGVALPTNVHYDIDAAFDGRPHHYAFVVAADRSQTLYVDGAPAPVVEDSLASPITTTPVVTVGATPDAPLAAMTGLISDVAFFDAALTADQVAEHRDAGRVPWAGDSTGQRIDRILDLIGWPASLRAIDVGEGTLGPAVFGGQTALDAMQRIAESEQGRLFVDAAGRITFHARGREYADPTETTVQYVFSDGGGDVGIVEGSFELSLDDTFLINRVTAARGSGSVAQTAIDQDSTDAYGPRGRDLSNLALAHDAAARGLAEAIVFRYKDPQTRAQAWTVNPELAAGDWPAILALEVGHRVTLSVTPQGTGDPIEVDLHVESIADTVTPEEWLVTFTGSPVDPHAGSYFAWGGVMLLTAWSGVPGQAPLGWNEQTSSTGAYGRYTAQGGVGQLYLNTGTDAYGAVGVVTNDPVPAADVAASFSFRTPLSLSEAYLAFAVRASDTLTWQYPSDGYEFEFAFSWDAVALYAPSGGTQGSALADEPFSFDADTTYQVRVEVIGDDIRLRIWADGDPEPTSWLIEVADSTHGDAGHLAFGLMGGSDTTRDDVFVGPLNVADGADAATGWGVGIWR